MRRADSVMGENFFRDPFVFAKGEPGRTATGERRALHLEQRNDVLVEAGIVFELLDQVEKNLWLKRFHFLPDKIDIVVNREMLRGVTDLVERGHNVRFRLPILGLQFLAQIGVDRRRSHAIE